MNMHTPFAVAIKRYGFTDKFGHPLENCVEYQALLKLVTHNHALHELVDRLTDESRVLDDIVGQLRRAEKLEFESLGMIEIMQVQSDLARQNLAEVMSHDPN